MKSLAIIVALLLPLGFGVIPHGGAQDKTRNPSEAKLKALASLVQGNNEFAFDLYRQLR